MRVKQKRRGSILSLLTFYFLLLPRQARPEEEGIKTDRYRGVKDTSESDMDMKRMTVLKEIHLRGCGMNDFRNLKVWQMGMELFESVIKDVEGFPLSEAARIIANQIIRSVFSITANIAEGYGRRKGKEFEHYLYIARGSANESIDWYEKMKRLGYLKNGTFLDRINTLNEIRAMLSGMINKAKYN